MPLPLSEAIQRNQSWLSDTRSPVEVMALLMQIVDTAIATLGDKKAADAFHQFSNAAMDRLVDLDIERWEVTIEQHQQA